MRAGRSLHVIPDRAKFKDRVGLYRDDGLAVGRATPKRN